MRRLGAITLVILLVVGTRMLASGSELRDGAANATLALGFVLIVSFLAGRLAKAVRLPSISAYIAVGLLFGPSGLSALAPSLAILDHETVVGLRLLDGAALGLIALTAGGELNLEIIRHRGRSIGLVVLSNVLTLIVSVSALVFLLRALVPGLAALSAAGAIAASVLLAVTSVPTSPAMTMAVIQEYRARGPMTQLVLGVVVAKDLVVVILFTAALSLAIRLIGAAPGGPEHGFWIVIDLAWEVLGSLAIGVLVGWLIRLYGERVGQELPLVVLAIAFLSGALSQDAQLSGLLVCMIAGFYVENYSSQGEQLIEAVERHSLPLYVVFFTMAGAGMHLQALKETLLVALTLVTARIVLIMAATRLATRRLGESRPVRNWAWTGFVGQAGITLGLAALVAQRLPRIGPALSTVIVACVALNELVGPIVFRLGLSAAGEIPAPSADDARSRPMRRMSTRELRARD